MNRFILNDELWSKLWPIMSQNGIYDKPDLRKTIEGILYKMRVGCPWRDLPINQWDWQKVYSRFNDWSKKFKLKNILESLIVEPDMEWKMIDGSIVKVHQHASGARKGEERAIGKSVAGNTSKIHMVVDSHGNPIDFKILNRGSISTALFVNHSNENGDLYFGSKTKERLPSSFFHVLRYLPSDLVFFSCNGNDVIKKYQLEKLNSRVHFSFIGDKERPLFGEKVPFLALKVVKKKLKRSSLANKVIKKAFQCSFKADLNLVNNESYILKVNNSFVYSTQEGENQLNFSFPCKLLDRKINKIKLNSINGSIIPSVDLITQAELFLKNKKVDLVRWKSISLNGQIVEINSKI